MVDLTDGDRCRDGRQLHHLWPGSNRPPAVAQDRRCRRGRFSSAVSQRPLTVGPSSVSAINDEVVSLIPRLLQIAVGPWSVGSVLSLLRSGKDRSHSPETTATNQRSLPQTRDRCHKPETIFTDQGLQLQTEDHHYTCRLTSSLPQTRSSIDTQRAKIRHHHWKSRCIPR